MSKNCVVGVYDEFSDASDAVSRLDDAGFKQSEVSFITHKHSDAMPTEAAQAGDRSEARAVDGAVTGGLLGIVLSTPLLALPGVGAILAVGPLAMGLTGAIAGGVLGSMSGWGVEQDHITKYQGYLDDGKTLIAVTGSPDRIAEAEEVLRKTKTDHTFAHIPNSADSSDIVG